MFSNRALRGLVGQHRISRRDAKNAPSAPLALGSSHSLGASAGVATLALFFVFAPAAQAADSGSVSEDWSVHGQVTHVWQYHPAFKAPYSGPNSLDPGSRGNETFDATLYLGFRP